MRALVAGGAGFVGSHVCEALLDRGWEVVCVDDLSSGSRENVADLLLRPGFALSVRDVADAPSLQADVILHLASPASPVDYQQRPMETLSANSLGTWRLLVIARNMGARLTFVSTSEVYGDPLVHPQPESYWGNVDPMGPRSCYDESKRFGEALVASARRTWGVRAAVVRVFNTYGPRMRLDDGRAMPELIGAALDGRPLPVHGDGSQTRSFCYVDDLADGLLAVALDPELDGEVVNLGNPEEVTVLDLAERIRALVPEAGGIEFGERRPGDPRRRRPDIEHARRCYGWEPRVSLDEGLRRTVAWYRTAWGG